MRYALVGLAVVIVGATAGGCVTQTPEEQGRPAPDSEAITTEAKEKGEPVPFTPVESGAASGTEQDVKCPNDICCASYCCYGTVTCVSIPGGGTRCTCNGVTGCCSVS